jgi:ParB-like chromosome segregation protein Spo0J
MDQIEQSARDGDGVAADSLADVEVRKVGLSQLRYGVDAPGGSVNARKADRGASVALVASIKGEGIILPLAVRQIDALYYAIDGDRRLNALYRIHCAARHDNDYPIVWGAVAGVEVPVAIHRHGDALELSLQAQLERADLHPVDRMEAFAEILSHETDGKKPSVEDLAARFSLRPAQVRQSLRLGVLAPAIRDAWRAGAMDAPTAEAFTLCKDEKQQIKVLDRVQAKVGPGGRITPHHVRQALKAQPGEVRRLLTFVGADCYEREGFAVSESLFSLMGVDAETNAAIGEPVVSNLVALKELAEKKLTVAALVATGLSNAEGGPWGWAKPVHEMPKGWETWPRMMIEHPKIKDRAAVGCVFSIDGAGMLQVEDRIYWQQAEPVKSQAGKEDESSAARPDGAALTQPSPIKGEGNAESLDVGPVANQSATTDWANADLPPRLQQLLAEQLTAGLSSAMIGRHDLMLPLLLAGIASGGEVIGIGDLGASPDRAWGNFAEAFDRYRTMDQAQIMAALAHVVTGALNLRIVSGQIPPAFTAGPKAIIGALSRSQGDKRLLRAILAGAFDVEGYVKAAPKAQLLMAIDEVCGPDQAKKLEGKGVGEIRKFAAVHIAEQKWLPPELTGGLLDIAVVKSTVKRPAPKVIKGRAKKAAVRAKPAPRKAAKGKRPPSPRLRRRT